MKELMEVMEGVEKRGRAVLEGAGRRHTHCSLDPADDLLRQLRNSGGRCRVTHCLCTLLPGMRVPEAYYRVLEDESGHDVHFCYDVIARNTRCFGRGQRSTHGADSAGCYVGDTHTHAAASGSLVSRNGLLEIVRMPRTTAKLRSSQCVGRVPHN